MNSHEELKNKLLNSDCLKSLVVESTVFNKFRSLDWWVEHSPFFMDANSNKLRELDVKARKYFSKGKYSCDVDILVECKSLNNYHIITANRASQKSDFDLIWTGMYASKDFTKLDQLLFKYDFSAEEARFVKEKLAAYCVPKVTYRWLNYHVKPFKIPTFNTYRETNINTSKDLDNSVIWKCIESSERDCSARAVVTRQY